MSVTINPGTFSNSPIGTVQLWLKDFLNTPSLPYGWQECDGSLITYGVYAGQNTPNYKNVFPMFAISSGSTGGSLSKTTSGPSSTRTAFNPVATVCADDRHTHDIADIRPPYVTFVPIMRIA